MNDEQSVDLRYLVKMGFLAGAIVLYTAVIGMIVVFSGRQLIAGVITLGTVLLLAPPLGLAFFVCRKDAGVGNGGLLAHGAMIGVLSSLPVIGLIIIGSNFDVRQMFVNVSPELIDLLTFGQGNVVGSLMLAALMTVAGLLGGGLILLPPLWRKAVIAGVSVTLTVGLLSELIILVLRPLLGSSFTRFVFQNGALRPSFAVIILIITATLSLFWQKRGADYKTRFANLGQGPRKNIRRGGFSIGTLILLMLPWIVGTYLSEVIGNVGLYILMALGLNIAVGLAGLLDLGYVTNFAVGAYVAAILTTTGDFSTMELGFWIIIPIAILCAMATGFVLALPVLRMRGDYLAIATLGFGEIIRILALSDWLSAVVGGPQGVLDIPKPVLFGYDFSGPQQFYYIILAACLVILFVSVRLNNSRSGRQWMALREDEDVAAAMGIDTTLSKLLAFTLSAASGGLAGAIFAAKLGTVFPQSFNLFVSINVLSVIIVGGMGSIPGIVVGALLLIGLPELLREFAEYRLLIYGILLIVVMLMRPEGLWPSAARRRELHDAMSGGDSDATVLDSHVISHGQEAMSHGLDM